MGSVIAMASYLSELIDAAIHHAVREAGFEKLKTVTRTYLCRFQQSMASLCVLHCCLWCLTFCGLLASDIYLSLIGPYDGSKRVV